MGDVALAAVYTVLNDGPDAPMQTLLVGGCVRNAVMGYPASDYDLATRLSCEDVMRRVESVGMRAVPTGLDHGTVTVVAHGRGFEVTRLRRDLETDGRHATVSFTDDWVMDAARRDFTMNALYADLRGQVFELVPGSYTDAVAGYVRFVGDAVARVAEDYLRILRFFRFHAWYGQGDLDAVGLAACADAGQHLRGLSRERVTQEMEKWLAAHDPVYTVEESFKNNILQHVFASTSDLDLLARLVRVQQEICAPDALLRLLVIAGFGLDDIKQNLRLSNKQIKYLDDVLNVELEDNVTVSSLRRDMTRQGRDAVLGRYILNCARGDCMPDYFNGVRDFIPPQFPVSGGDLIAAGVTPGPELGRILALIREEWIQQDFPPISREDLAALIKRHN